MARTGPIEAGEFGDLRLSARHLRLIEMARESPGSSFPEWVDSPSELESLYRFMSNESVTVEAMLEPHFRTTCDKSAGQQVLVLHDTTQFEFGGEVVREGLGPRGKSKRADGFFGHFALAASADVRRSCLGLLGFLSYVQARKIRGRKVVEARPKSAKWFELIRQCEERAQRPGDLVHVMDREADDYALFAALDRSEFRFICRAKDRTVDGDDGAVGLRELLGSVEHSIEREVQLSPRAAERSPVNRKHHPPRPSRPAQLRIRAHRVAVLRPKGRPRDSLPDQVELNAVQVYEPKPPTGQAPIDWLIMTNEPINTLEAIERIVDSYKARWLIEEYFKALKTGCSYERRQLETLHGLLNALGLLAPIAVDLLRLRETARDNPNAPASEVISVGRLEVLRAISHRHPLGPKPRAVDILLAVAGLGGHLKNNGHPGWLVLHRGFIRLLDAEAGWLASAQRGRKK